MKKKITLAVLAAAMTMPTFVAAPAFADPGYNNGRTYHGHHRRYHYRCKKSSGTTGLVAGAVGGGLIGSALGGGTVGTLVGAGGGALLGKHLDQKHDAAQNRKNGC